MPSAPLNEYKSEAFDLFNGLVGHLREQVTSQLMRVEVVFQPPEQQDGNPFGDGAFAAGGYNEGLPPMFAEHLDPATGENEFSGRGTGSFGGAGPALGFAAVDLSDAPTIERDPNDQTTWGKVSRNEPCPCGSGRKYKHCHGRYTA
jgi:preprotein translocase subunit SecA